MKKQLPNNPMESAFRKILETPSDQDASWETPGDQVWEGIASEIKEPTRKTPFWWSIAVALVIGIGFGYLLFTVKAHNDLPTAANGAETIEEAAERHNFPTAGLPSVDLKGALEVDPSTNSKKESGSPSFENNPVVSNAEHSAKVVSPKPTKDLLSDNQMKKNNPLTIKKNQERKTSIEPLSWNITQQTSQERLPKNRNTVTPINNIPDNTPTRTQENSSSNQQIAIVSKLPNKATTLTLKSEMPSLKLVKSPGPPPIDLPRKQTNWYAGLTFAPALQTRTINGTKKDTKKKLNDKEQPVFTYGTSLKLGYSMSPNWSVETGAGYYRSKVVSSDKKKIVFTNVGEVQSADGSWKGAYDTDLETSYGDLKTDLTLIRSSNTSIDEGEVIFVKIVADQRYHYLQFPLFVKYKIGNQRIKASARAGLVSNFLMHKKIDIQKYPFDDRRVNLGDSATSSYSEKGGMKFSNLDVVLGFGTEISLSSRWSFVLEPTLSKSITALSSKKELKTYPLSANLNVGLNYYF